MQDHNDYDPELDDQNFDELPEDDFVSEDFDAFDDPEMDMDYDGGDDWEEDIVQSDDVAANPDLIAKEKKSLGGGLSFNTMVIMGAVILGVLVFGYQLAKTPPTQTAAVDNFSSALTMEGAADGPIFGQAEQENTEEGQAQDTSDIGTSDQKGFLYDPEMLDSIQIDPEPEVAEIEVISTPQDDLIIPEFSQPKIQEKVQPIIDPVPQIEVTESEEIIELAPQLNEEVIDTVEIESEFEPIVTMNEEKISNQIQSVLDRLEQMDSKIEAMQKATDRQSETMANNLSVLENKISKVQSQVNSAEVKAVPQSPLKAKAVKSVPQKKAAPKPQPAKVVKPIWELRAAQPNKAWVSLKGQNNTRAIVVGDQLDGLGRVQEILFENNQWVIRADKGQIRQ